MKIKLSFLVLGFFSAAITFAQTNPVSSPDTILHPNYTIHDITLTEKAVALSGTLFQPVKINHPPVALIIAGSGPTDRDGNTPLLPGKNNSLKQLADSLANHGIASLRYDKRGIGKSKVTTIEGLREENISIDSIIADAEVMYNWLQTQGYTKIFIAGHSEGSLIGLKLSEKVHPAGFISLEGAGRKAGDVLKEQVNAQLPEPLRTIFGNDIDSLEKGFTVKKVDPGLASLLRPSIQPYMRSWLALDPQKIIASLHCPVLLVQGTHDIQVLQKDVQALYQAQPAAQLLIIENMNHVLKKVYSDKIEDNKKAYSDPSLPIPAELIRACVQFISGQK